MQVHLLKPAAALSTAKTIRERTERAMRTGILVTPATDPTPQTLSLHYSRPGSYFYGLTPDAIYFTIS